MRQGSRSCFSQSISILSLVMLCEKLRSPFQNAPPERFSTAFDSHCISPSKAKGTANAVPFTFGGDRGASAEGSLNPQPILWMGWASCYPLSLVAAEQQFSRSLATCIEPLVHISPPKKKRTAFAVRFFLVEIRGVEPLNTAQKTLYYQCDCFLVSISVSITH